MTSSYILCRCRSGLNDCLNQLWNVTTVAKKLNRDILLDMVSYSATDLNEVFDFSKYPVKVYTNIKEQIIIFSNTKNIYPKEYEPFLENKEIIPSEKICVDIDSGSNVSKDTLLVHDSNGGGHNAQLVFRYLRFQPQFIQNFNQRYSLPPVHNAIHVRNTDLSADQTQMHTLVLNFLQNSKQNPVFIISDNQETVNEFVKKYNCQKTYTNFLSGTNLHFNGSKKYHILIDALHDLLILIKSKNLLIIPVVEKGVQSISGFSLLAKNLHDQIFLVKELCKLQRAKPSTIY
jgi:hypothetical protein